MPTNAVAVKFPNPRRAHARCSWLSARRSCANVCGLSSQTQLPRHGGLTPAALGACVFVHRKSRNCVGGRTRADKSGGRKPPVVSLPRLQRRSPTRRPGVCRTFAEAPLQQRLPRHGGLTPAAPGYPRDDRVRMCADCPRRRSCRATAGSRPLLPLRVSSLAEIRHELQARPAVKRQGFYPQPSGPPVSRVRMSSGSSMAVMRPPGSMRQQQVVT